MITVQNEQSLNQEVFADNTQGGGVTFVTAGAWTSLVAETSTRTKADSDWVSISPDHGDVEGTYTIAIGLLQNNTGADHSAVITISCKRSNIGINITQKVTKEDGIRPVTSITVEPGTLDLKVDDTAILVAIVAPENADNIVTWSSSNVEIATVGNTGKVTATGAGTVVITAATHDGT
jgi:uncharacterized protein YjdB